MSRPEPEARADRYASAPPEVPDALLPPEFRRANRDLCIPRTDDPSVYRLDYRHLFF